MKNRVFQFMSLLLFIVGAAMGMFYFMTATWADIESSYYGFTRYYAEPTTALKCPVFLTTADTWQANIVFKNTTENNLRPTIWMEASNRGFLVPQTQRLALAPGESGTISLPLADENKVMNHFVFVKIFTFTSYPMPNAEQTCGIYIMELALITGQQVSIILWVGGPILMALAIYLWSKGQTSNTVRGRDLLRAMTILAVVVGVGIVSVFLANWVLGLIATVVSLLLIGVIIANLIQKI